MIDRGGHVFLIEPDALFSRALALSLSTQKADEPSYAVTSFPDSESAEHSLETSPDRPDVFILDTELGPTRRRGLTYLQRLKAHDSPLRNIPVIVLGPDNDPAIESEARASGAAEFLPTPFSTNNLRRALRNAQMQAKRV